MQSVPHLSTHLLLVRHGQSLSNRDGEAIGEDSGLTELGWRQAHLLAGWLARHDKPAIVVSSKMTRAQQTAGIIASHLGLPVVVREGLEEADRPYWEELALQSVDPLGMWDTCQQPVRNAPNYLAFRTRIRQALAGILDECSGQTIVVVTHSGVIGTILRSLFGGHNIFVDTDNGAITHLCWQDGRWRLLAHNRTAHLAPLSEEGEPAAGSERVQSDEGNEQIPSAARAVRPLPPGEQEIQGLVALAAPAGRAAVLDISAGAGEVAMAFAPLVAHVTAVDMSPSLLEKAEAARLKRGLQNIAFRWSEPSALPFPRQSFDLAVCRDVLHRLGDPGGVFEGLRRVLSPDGRLIIDEVIGSDDPVKRATQHAIELRRDPSFIRLYTVQEIEHLLDEAGFCLLKTDRYGVVRHAAEWLAAAGQESARSEVRSMLEAALEADAAGLEVRKNRDGTLVFTHHRVRLLARRCSRPEHG